MPKELAQFLIIFITILALIYRWAIFAYIIISWLPASWNKFRGILNQIVYPVIRPFSWAKIGNLSFSAIIAFIIIDFLAAELIKILSVFV